MTLRAFHPDYTEQRMFIEYKRCKVGRLKERYQTILLSYRGWVPERIAEVVFREVNTVRTWIKEFNMSGISGLSFDEIPGRPARLSDEEREELKKN